MLPLLQEHGMMDRCLRCMDALVQCLKLTHLMPSSDISTTEAVVITSEVSAILECQDSILNAVGSCLNVLCATTGVQDVTMDVGVVVEFVKLLIDLVTNTTPSSQEGETFAQASCKWELAPAVDKAVFRGGLLSTMSNALELLGFICKLLALPNTVPAQGTGGTGPSITASLETYKAIAMVLLRCSSLTYTEIVLPCVAAVGYVGQRSADRLVDKSVNAILSTAVLRLLENPKGYSVTSVGEETLMDATLGAHIGQAKKDANKIVAMLRIMDACFNSIIDLHASDELIYLDNFKKLLDGACITKMTQQLKLFRKELSSNASLFNGGKMRVLHETFYETMDNTESFLQYKASFIANDP